MKELKECLNVPWPLSSFSAYCKTKNIFLLIKTELRSVTRKDRSFAARSWLAVLDLAQKSDMMDLERTLIGFLGTQSVEDLLEAGLNPSPLIDLLHEVSTPDATVRYILIQRVVGSILRCIKSKDPSDTKHFSVKYCLEYRDTSDNNDDHWPEEKLRGSLYQRRVCRHLARRLREPSSCYQGSS